MNPLTGLYGGATALRNTLFDRGMLRTRRLEKPVVSVGNLSAGGSGKTPFVIALGVLLKERGISFDVLSRGYRRQTRGVLVVEPDGSAADFGDEPVLIARCLGVPVVVGESRYQAGRVAEQKFQSQLHLLDDGFQHRSLARDFDIVLLATGDLEDRLLPSGRLREPASALRRADAIVVPQDLTAGSSTLRGKPVWRMHRETELRHLLTRPVVFCGIAKPEQFFAQMRAAGITPAAETAFPDHHPYRQRDVDRLAARQRDLGADGFVTTEKDQVNLGTLSSQLTPLSIATLRLTIDRPADLVDTILSRIAERKPSS